jgi:hypothetical protein
MATLALIAAVCSMPLEGFGIKPNAPAAPVLTAGNGSLTVSWTEAERAESYKVYFSADTEVPAEPARATSERSTVFTGLTNGTTYYAWVQAVNARGDSPLSERASGTTLALEAPADITLIPSNNSLTVSWIAVEFADSYNLYYSGNETLPAEPAQTGITGITGTTATISGLTNDMTYYVWVQVVNAGGSSPLSGRVSGTTLALDTPAAPVLTAGDSSLTATWMAVDMAESYMVYLGTEAMPSAEPSYTGTELSTTFTGLVNATTYYVWVRAKNNAGTVSALSPAASGTPLVPPIDNITYVGAWTLQGDGSRKSPAIGHGNTTKMRVNFTSTANSSITILLKVSSVGNSCAFISTLDNASATFSSGYYPDSRISGTTSVPITIPVPTSGNHFIDIGYSKNNSYTSSSEDCAWFTVIP